MSPEEHITNERCSELRSRIYGMIFPRWILMSIGGAFMLAMILLYAMAGKNTVSASDAMKKAEIGEVRMEHLKEGQVRIEGVLIEQQKLLGRIDKKLPDNGGP